MALHKKGNQLKTIERNMFVVRGLISRWNNYWMNNNWGSFSNPMCLISNFFFSSFGYFYPRLFVHSSKFLTFETGQNRKKGMQYVL